MEEIQLFTRKNIDNSIYSIDYEDRLKISLIYAGDKVDVKFGGEYLAESVTLSRGDIVFYNYCEKFLDCIY